jgi:DNA-binding response OmpR family regulator
VPESAGVTKPFHYPELLARIGAVLGRVSHARDREVIRDAYLGPVFKPLNS